MWGSLKVSWILFNEPLVPNAEAPQSGVLMPCPPTLWPWQSCLTALCLTFSPWRMGINDRLYVTDDNEEDMK